MSITEKFGAATSPVLGCRWTEEAAGARRTVPPVHRDKGTGVPVAGFGTSGVAGLTMRAGQVQRAVAVRIAVDADPGIPPRWGPVRC